MYFLIDDKFEFKPNSLTLKNLEDDSQTVTLSAPASRCFLFLLENAPNIVSQKEIIEFVWGSEGMIIPKNTLYQNISIIRRELRNIGCENKIITTVSRKGFVISSDNIKTHIQDCNITGPNDDKQKPLIIQKPRKSKLKKYIISLATLLLPLLLFIIIYSKINNTENFYQGYKYEKAFQECELHYNENNEIALQRILSEVKSHLSCKSFRYVYIDVKPSARSNTIVTCARPFTSDVKNKCISLYILRKVNYEK